MIMLFQLATTLFHPLFAAACTIPEKPFFFLPSWWEYLPVKVDVLNECVPDFQLPDGLLAVGLAILDMLLRLVGFVAVISTIIAGIQHIFSGGDVQKAASARKRIWNSLIGLGIAIVATAAVTFVGTRIGGP